MNCFLRQPNNNININSDHLNNLVFFFATKKSNIFQTNLSLSAKTKATNGTFGERKKMYVFKTN